MTRRSAALDRTCFGLRTGDLSSPEMPKGGVDIFACNRQVCDAVLSIAEPNSSLVAQLFWVGFRRAFVPYTQAATPAWQERLGPIAAVPLHDGQHLLLFRRADPCSFFGSGLSAVWQVWSLAS